MKLYILVDNYMKHRQSFGERGCRNAGYILRQLERFAGKNLSVKDITKNMTLTFLYGKTGTVTASWFCKHTVLKDFFNYAAAQNYIDVIPLSEDLPQRPAKFIPYIYSDDELKRMFGAVFNIYQKEQIKTDPYMVHTILILTYTLGLRRGETLAVRLRDIDLGKRVILIKQSKFYKSRLVTFNEEIGKIISNYLMQRAKNGKSQNPNSYLFLRKNDKPIVGSVLDTIFSKIRIEAGIKRNDGAIYQPRIHDLRHTFAVNRLVSWYRQGKDVQRLLPFLSTYLGHQSLNYTSVYLSMTDELLREANIQFENFVKINNHEE